MRAFVAALLLGLAALAVAQVPERERAYEELLAAHKVLQESEAARELGIEPQPGCRPNTGERQKRLEENVDSARKRLDQALARRAL